MSGIEQSAREPYVAVIVHFQSPSIYEVVAQLNRQTEKPAQVWIVDNSDDLDHSLLPNPTFPLEVLPPAGNRGYAAAVNSVRARVGSAAMLLVLTHEVQMDADCAERLASALRADHTVASAGPTLRLRSDPSIVFSSGGDLDHWAWPRHRHEQIGEAPRQVSWIDGSVMMLRVATLDQVGWLDEDYFLYYEEIDLALRFAAVGLTTVAVPGAVARQEPGAFPPYLANRNRLLLVRRHPQALGFPRVALVVRMMAEIAWTARRRGARTVPPAIRGLVAGIRGTPGRPR